MKTIYRIIGIILITYLSPNLFGIDTSTPISDQPASELGKGNNEISPTEQTIQGLGEKKDKVELLIQNGHTSLIKSIAYTRNGKYLATGSYDRTVKIWNTIGKLVAEIITLAGVEQVLFSPDGKIIAANVGNEKIILWNIDGTHLSDIEGHSERINYFTFSPDGKTITTVSKDKTAKIWSIEGKLLHSLIEHTASVNYVSYSPNGKTLTTVSDDSTGKIWSIDGSLLHNLVGHLNGITQAVYSPDGTAIATASRDKTAKIWSVDGKLLKELGGHTNPVHQIEFLPDGKKIITASGFYTKDSNIKIWSNNGILLQDIKNYAEHIDDIFPAWSSFFLPSFAISPNGKTIATRATSANIKIWNIDGILLHTISSTSDAIIYSPNGKFLVSSNWDSLRKRSTCRIWSYDAKLLYELKDYSENVRYNSIHKNKIIRMSDESIKVWTTDGKLINKELYMTVNRAFSPDGSRFVTSNNEVKIWSIDGKPLHTIKEDMVTKIQYSPNGKFIALGLLNGPVKIYSSNGEFIHTLSPLGNDRVVDIDYSPDGKNIAVSRGEKYINGGISIYNDKGELIKKIYDGEAFAVSFIHFSPDAKTVATCKGWAESNDTTGKIWSIDGQLLHTLQGHESPLTGVIHSNDGKILASGSRDGTIKLWNNVGGLMHSVRQSIGVVTIISYSLNGKYLIAGLDNGAVLVIDTALGQIVATLLSHNGSINSIGFLSSENILFSSSTDNKIKYWDMNAIVNSVSKYKVIYENYLIATQLFIQDSSILFTPDSYYMVSSEDSLAHLSFKKDGKLYDFDQFDLKFNRPDIIMDRMRGIFLHKQESGEDNDAYNNRVQDYKNKITLYKNYYEHRIKQNGFTPEQLSGENKIHAPEVSAVKVNNIDVESKGFDSKTKNKKVKLSFTIEDEKESNLDVVGYKVFVQGVPLHGQYIKKFPEPGKRKTVEEEITLSTLADIGDSIGSNTIEISGYTSDGIESSKQKIYLNYEDQDLKKKGNLYLVTLGTEKYKSGKKSDLNDLNYSIDDAEDLQKLFKEKNDKDKTYKSIIPIFLKDDEITRSGANKIRSVLSKSEVDDTVIFFISGHGVRADTPVSTAEAIAKEFGITQSIGEPSNKKDFLNVYYYMTSTSSTKEPWKNGIPMESFRFALDGIQARQKILLIDTCQSGDKIDLTGYKPSKQRIEEIKKLRDSFKNTQMEKGITRIRGNEEEEELSSSDKYYRSLAYEWELRELSKMFPELRRGTGTIEISAASGTQSALESGKWKNGAFTFTIKEAILSGKAKDGADITAKSLRKYILDRVERLTEGKQIPMVTRDISGRDFRITK
jgi:WD40 repeat protein